ncbi:MAG TPA: class I SAM-dependent methyltransferase [Anaerolineales bacterium]|nr:class I SAM-dependent methyltransferase [Anaerolineales bacterium]
MSESIATPVDRLVSGDGQPLQDAKLEAIRLYWNEHIHDLEIATQPIGSHSFFEELAEYRFDKLRYLPKLVDFSAYRGKELLEVGCGVGIDLIRFARSGAHVTGIDLSQVAIDLARQYFGQEGLAADLRVMNGEVMLFEDDSFDVVYAHGVLQYTADTQKMVKELYRVLRPGGQAILMVYNRISWLNAMSKVMSVGLEHEDAPVLNKYSIGEFMRMLSPFSQVRILPERFPVETRLHHGLKATLYNKVFVKGFHVLPKSWVRPLGWHLMAFASK